MFKINLFFSIKTHLIFISPLLPHCNRIPFEQPLYSLLNADTLKVWPGNAFVRQPGLHCWWCRMVVGSRAGCPTKPISEEAGLSGGSWLSLVGDLVVSDYIMVWGGGCRCCFGICHWWRRACGTNNLSAGRNGAQASHARNAEEEPKETGGHYSTFHPQKWLSAIYDLPKDQ